MRDTGADRGDPADEWMTVHQACALIGVSPATLRRWNDAGEVPAFTTPGGHRRFSRSMVLGLLPPSHRHRLGLTTVGSTAQLGATFRIILGSTPAAPDDGLLVTAADESPQSDHRSGIGRALAEFVDAGSAVRRRGRATREAVRAAEQSGRELAASSGRLSHGVEAFLRLRRAFLGSLADKMLEDDLDVADATDLFVAASDAFDQAMTAMLRGYRAEMTRTVRRE
jgi:excisionase family DNA binding protein